ncbi:hypothetical protein [Thermomonospora umbrina]|uniref:Uncharacterized protein n=1 Tax=Thermomonospora umbrina TaxID=111806 RepID=A0A3D9SWJ1_9ACTN|nr:hypothetical protein [Thermomonospora umbrina]REF00320.1 hypothetical protein DFJ69_5851 [Thermomonospora umbrina]
MTAPFRQWAARVDGENIFDITGPDAEAMARTAAQTHNGVVVYRDYEGPTENRPYSVWGPWNEAV